jgi:hypothetical protein
MHPTITAMKQTKATINTPLLLSSVGHSSRVCHGRLVISRAK